MDSLLAWTCVAVLAAVPEPTTTPAPPPDPEVLELHWRAPAGCPTQDDLERRIRALLPNEPIGEGVLVIEGDVTMSSRGATLVLRSTFEGRTESREIEAPACGELLESTAVLLAVALEPSATISGARRAGRSEEPRVDEPPSQDVTAEVDPTVTPVDDATSSERSTSRGAADRPRTPARRRLPTGVALRLSVGLEAGALPPPSAAISGAASLLWRRARIEAHGVWLAPRTARESDGRGATYQLGTAGLRGCGRLFAGAIEVPLCGGAEGGALRVRPRAIDTAVGHAPWAAAIASAGIARAWGPIAIVATVDGLVRLVGNRFEIGDALSLRQFPVSIRALLGVELRPGGRSD